MTPLVYLIAGEPSGDLLGGRLMAALKSLTGGDVAFAGIGGEAMRDEGLVSLFPQRELAVMGLAEVVPRIPAILRRLRQTVADIESKRPAVVVTIDSWGFTGRVAARLKANGSNVPRVHYVAPMVWAWKERRAHQLAKLLDHLMCLLPNEPPYFRAAGLESSHVGHPVLEAGAGKADGQAFRAGHGVPQDAPLLCVLPGSRRSETTRLLPVFRETVERLARTRTGLRVVVPTVETVADEVSAAVSSWPVPVTVVRGLADRYGAFAASDAAIAASGTVALELGLSHVPMVIAYRLSPLTAFLARRLLKVKRVCLLNILTDSDVVPELLQGDCRADLLSETVNRLLDDDHERARQIDGARLALEKLGLGGESPSVRAAREVIRHMEGKHS